MPKRKAAQLNPESDGPNSSNNSALRRSTRLKTSVADTDMRARKTTESSAIPTSSSLPQSKKARAKSPQSPKSESKKDEIKSNKNIDSKSKSKTKSAAKTSSSSSKSKSKTKTSTSLTKTKDNSNNDGNVDDNGAKTDKKSSSTSERQEGKAEEKEGQKWYWLMKAEPESRLENDVDVRFSIDDLASKSKPEPWDGIRAYAARNNLRSMKKGELAFFYHSNCKEPGIVGTMEIVQEHSPDLSAHDPKQPYYDPSSKPEDPKWSVVHVKFRSKFAKPIGLKELREMGKPGNPLENMQMLKQSRLSVSRVSPSEWEHLMDLVQRQGGEVFEST